MTRREPRCTHTTRQNSTRKPREEIMMEHNTPGTTATVLVVVPFISGEAQSEFLEGELVFNPSDPYAVSMNLEARSGTVTWTFARELLEQGLNSPSGDGAVQGWPCLSS